MMAIERYIDILRRDRVETHYPRLSDLDKLRNIFMLAVIAISTQACSFLADPIPGYNDPDAQNDILDVSPEDAMDAIIEDIDLVDLPTDTAPQDDLNTDTTDLGLIDDTGTDDQDTYIDIADVIMDSGDITTDTANNLEDLTDSTQDTLLDDMDISIDSEVDVEPENPDPDNDGIINDDDICPSLFNPSQIRSFPEELNCTALVEDFICFNSGISSDCQNNPDHPPRIASVIFQEWPSNGTTEEWTPTTALKQAITITAENCGRVLISRNGTASYGRVLEPGESTCINYELGLNDPLNQSLTVCLISEPDGLTSSHCVQLR